MKKIFVVLLSTVLFNVCAFSQSMSDEDVIIFVQSEQAKGSNQTTIVQKLLQKGVTTDQLRRIRKKYSAEQSQMGAVDITGKTLTKTRLRTNKEKAEDEYRKQNGYMVRSQRETEDLRKKNKKERELDLNDEIGFLDIDSLMYYQKQFGDNEDKENAVFGRNIFNNENLTFEPTQNIATPANYRLGAGDVLYIDVWGNSQQSYEEEVSPDGVVVLEGIGPVKVGGLSISQAKQKLASAINRYYSGCSVEVSLGNNRSVQVQVVGEVVTPGTYTLSSLSTAFNALYAAGGINDIGTLRNIKVYRNGRQIATIDVYDYLLNGNTQGDIRLQDNDIISVGPYECLVNVRGKIKRPMWYEMKHTESVKQVLQNAGGFSGDAYTKNVRLTRKAGEEYSVHTIDEFKMGSFNLMDRDSIYVDSVIPRFSNKVEVRGAVKHAGAYQLGGDIQSVRALLEAADGLREDAYTSRAVMHREKDDLTLEMVSLDIEGILNGTIPDVPLKKGDMLFVPSRVDMKGEQTLTISGEVIYPGIYQYAENTTVEDLILMAGGLTPAASMAKVDIFRRIQDFNAQVDPDQSAETFSISLNDGLRSGDTSITLMPYDQIVVRRSPVYREQQSVKVSGSINFEGNYAMTSKNYRLSDLIKDAGGLSHLAYAKGARLTRIMTEDERVQRENSLRAAQIQMYEEAMQSDKSYDMVKADSLLSLKLDMGDTYPVAVNLDKAIANPGGADDIVLRKGDELIIPQFSNTVKVSGEVTYPISMNYTKGNSANYYIRHAGGFSNRAKKKGTYVIYMNGSVEKIRRRSKSAVEPGCEIVVPTQKTSTKRMSGGEWAAIASGGSSLATIVVALISILSKK